jgi:hypothetical protein
VWLQDFKDGGESSVMQKVEKKSQIVNIKTLSFTAG